MLQSKSKPFDRERLLFVLMVSTCLLASASAVVTAWVALRVAHRMQVLETENEPPGGCASEKGEAKKQSTSTTTDAPTTSPPPRRASEPVGQSVGSPRAGALFGGRKLQPGAGYVVRNEKASFGTNSTIAHLQRTISRVHREVRRLHPLVIGDLSSELGGRLLGHFSHQSGRDVDLGLFYRRRPPGFPERFVDGHRDNLHFKATFRLLEALAETREEPGGVEWVLLDYELQRMLYKWGRRNKVSSETLEELFQYPRGPTEEVGLVRHFPQHRDHMHVRFACGSEDKYCRSPEGPPAPESSVYRWMTTPEGDEQGSVSRPAPESSSSSGSAPLPAP